MPLKNLPGPPPSSPLTFLFKWPSPNYNAGSAAAIQWALSALHINQYLKKIVSGLAYQQLDNNSLGLIDSANFFDISFLALILFLIYPVD